MLRPSTTGMTAKNVMLWRGLVWGPVTTQGKGWWWELLPPQGGRRVLLPLACHSWWCRPGQAIHARQAVVIGVDAFMVRPCVVAFLCVEYRVYLCFTANGDPHSPCCHLWWQLFFDDCSEGHFFPSCPLLCRQSQCHQNKTVCSTNHLQLCFVHLI